MLGSRDRNAYRELDPVIKARSKQIIMEIKLPTGICSMKEKIRTVIEVQKGSGSALDIEEGIFEGMTLKGSPEVKERGSCVSGRNRVGEDPEMDTFKRDGA